jgi:tripeptidyl-peptidase I
VSSFVPASLSASSQITLLDTKYNVYTHEETGEQVVRTMGYSLPSVLEGHIETVAPTT